MEVLSGIEKEPFLSLAEADDRHTKKVKNRVDSIGESREVIIGQVDDVLVEHREAMKVSRMLEDGVSFKDKLMRKGGNHKPPQSIAEIEFQDLDVRLVQKMICQR